MAESEDIYEAQHNFQIHTKRLLLRAVNQSDKEAYHALRTTPAVMQYMYRSPVPFDDVPLLM